MYWFVWLVSILIHSLNIHYPYQSIYQLFRFNIASVRSISGWAKLFGGEGLTLCCYYYSSPPILQKNKTPIQYALLYLLSGVCFQLWCKNR